MPIGPEMPTTEDIQVIAERFGLRFSPDQLKGHRSLVEGAVKSCRFIDVMPERKPPVKYPRDSGWRPAPDDNPFNGWFWRCNIEGSGKGPLKGKRIAVKDVVSVAGLPMANGSRVLEGFIPDVDATIVTRILDAGGTLVGKTACEDFSGSGGGHTCSMGPVQNPRKPTHSPGGSSNGSAVVLVTGDADLAIGADQGGSIRMPSAWSGVYGLKPTYGLVPYTGCAGIEMTIDHLGPMATDTEGLARLLSVIAGPDPLDPRQRGILPPKHGYDYLKTLNGGVKGKKIAVLKQGFGHDGLDVGFPPSSESVDKHVKTSIDKFRKLGATVEEVSIPLHLDAYHIWLIILIVGGAEGMLKGAGLGTNWSGFYHTNLGETLARGLKTRINNLSATTKSMLLTSEFLRDESFGRYYWKAQNLRQTVVDAYDKVLGDYDFIAMPTMPFTATPLVDRDASPEDTVAGALNMLRNTCVADLTGHPAISIPCGLEDGLPIGLMLTGRHLDDAGLLGASAAFEGLEDWQKM
ncbi:amidase [Aminobacter sp. MSH1]|uniref:amidase n=1 Tax=Aminobacter sp. MSH1 TaxID=374606 RepID=UPI000D36230B|nr:amidase [Aminobacter sp. MSH1]